MKMPLPVSGIFLSAHRPSLPFDYLPNSVRNAAVTCRPVSGGDDQQLFDPTKSHYVPIANSGMPANT